MHLRACWEKSTVNNLLHEACYNTTPVNPSVQLQAVKITKLFLAMIYLTNQLSRLLLITVKQMVVVGILRKVVKILHPLPKSVLFKSSNRTMGKYFYARESRAESYIRRDMLNEPIQIENRFMRGIYATDPPLSSMLSRLQLDCLLCSLGS